MASEAVVSFVVGKLGDLLIEEARFLHGVRSQVELILRELRRMQHFLKDADAKQKRDERVKNWVAEIRQVSYEVEDVIDSFILSEVAYKRRRHGSQGRIKMYSCIFSKLITRYKVGKEIQRIKLKISEISSSRLTYGIRDINEGGQDQASSSSQALHEHRRIFALLEEPDVVGMQDDVKILKKQLINNKSSLCVVSIVGMGGSGDISISYADNQCCGFKWTMMALDQFLFFLPNLLYISCFWK
eukprot:TRINITY_DN4704_c1_g2_i1.p1 TRINITY_DN4704_c1_g2~~TRINITY_DN4704_c1_g2_i1.p1  ORF type:complete len:243 (-),score=36.62 TRINITY_DN4704_c1_g2_i1:187-915(-)